MKQWLFVVLRGVVHDGWAIQERSCPPAKDSRVTLTVNGKTGEVPHATYVVDEVDSIQRMVTIKPTRS